MKTNILIEALEARIAPAATVVIDPIKLIVTITADPAGDDLTIVQDATGAIDILDNANANASLTPSGMPELIRGIIYLGDTGDDKTVTQLQNGPIDVAGLITSPSLPEGFIIVKAGGTNEHTVEAVAEAVTIGKKFQFFGSSGDDTLKLNKVARSKDFFFDGGDGTDSLEIQGSSILGKLLLLSLETMTGTDNTVLGATTVDNSKNVFASDIQITASLITVTAFNAGTLSAKLGGDVDEIATEGSFKALKLDAGLGSGVHNGAEKTFGLTAKSRKNFI